jgi:hypothetical protein
MTQHNCLRSDPGIAERAIVLQILREDHDERWSHAELQADLIDLELWALTSAIERLEHEGVVQTLDKERSGLAVRSAS